MMWNDFENILTVTSGRLEKEFPLAIRFFSDYGVSFSTDQQTIEERLREITYDQYGDLGISRERLLQNFESFLSMIEQTEKSRRKVESITILGGQDKTGNKELQQITLTKGSITSIVGPTGSGKSRLLADIEWLAQGDTPTARTILINGEKPHPDLRFSLEHKLVAQLSQNMNFVMDASVGEFVAMHAESRMVLDVDNVVKKIIEQANLLAGEGFSTDTALTALSGGQSRALMIADTAILSTSPVVLIDEIENAGIDRKKALSLLVKNEKIILMATHDPILALMAEQRLVIKNGGIHTLIHTSDKEKKQLEQLEQLDAKMLALRNLLRSGGTITEMDMPGNGSPVAIFQ